MKKIDLKTWERFGTFDYFRKLDHPRYIMTFELDITHFYQKVKKDKQSFYLSFIHFVMSVINEHDAFHYRMEGDDVVYFDTIHPSFTDLIENTDRFRIVTINYESDQQTFIKHAKEKSIKQGHQFIDLEEDKRKDLVYITTFPWATYTQVTHAENHDPQDAIPRLVWGKFRDVEGKLIMPFSIEVHHGFVDGYHLGLLIQDIEKRLQKI
ncbi:MAG: CatA-like O-acetyltransferase [Acholeplasmataceae bacterium]|nr:hypothetical protein [Acholeplasmataceae bacterium]